MSEFTIAGLRVVREAARHGSFSVAAERLGYTQSAISRQIALMEQAAGQPLFERLARGVRPTEIGLVVVRHAEVVLGELRATRQDIQDLVDRPPGRLRVGAFSTAMAALVPRAIAAFAGTEPRTRVTLREGLSPGLLSVVGRGRLDLAVVSAVQEVPDGVELTPLIEDQLFVAVARGNPLAGRASVSLEVLRRERWITGSVEAETTLLGAWADPSWRPEIAFVVRDWVAKLGLVAAGAGVTVVPGLVVPSLPPDIEIVRIDHPAAVRPTAIAVRAGVPEERGRRIFTEALRDVVAGLVARTRERSGRF